MLPKPVWINMFAIYLRRQAPTLDEPTAFEIARAFSDDAGRLHPADAAAHFMAIVQEFHVGPAELAARVS